MKQEQVPTRAGKNTEGTQLTGFPLRLLPASAVGKVPAAALFSPQQADPAAHNGLALQLGAELQCRDQTGITHSSDTGGPWLPFNTLLFPPSCNRLDCISPSWQHFQDEEGSWPAWLVPWSVPSPKVQELLPLPRDQTAQETFQQSCQIRLPKE